MPERYVLTKNGVEAMVSWPQPGPALDARDRSRELAPIGEAWEVIDRETGEEVERPQAIDDARSRRARSHKTRAGRRPPLDVRSRND